VQVRPEHQISVWTSSPQEPGDISGETILSIFSDDDEPKIVVFMAASWEAFKADRKSAHWIRFDAHTGVVLKRSKPFDGDGRRFLDIMLSLHRDLFAGLPGNFSWADGDPVS